MKLNLAIIIVFAFAGCEAFEINNLSARKRGAISQPSGIKLREEVKVERRFIGAVISTDEARESRSSSDKFFTKVRLVSFFRANLANMLLTKTSSAHTT